MTTRGERNNNPGNVDRGSIKWQGMADDQSGDSRFIIFKTPQWGIRTIARLLLTYQNQHDLHTVRGLISRWAPPGENNTGAYIAAVSTGVGVGPDDEIDVDVTAVMLPLVKAIIVHENGENPYPDSLILEALNMAGVSDAKPKALAKQGSFVAQVGAAGTLGVAGAAHVATQLAGFAPAVKDATDQLSAFSGAPIISHVTTVLMTVGGGLTLLGIAAAMLKQKAS